MCLHYEVHASKTFMQSMNRKLNARDNSVLHCARLQTVQTFIILILSVCQLSLTESKPPQTVFPTALKHKYTCALTSVLV